MSRCRIAGAALLYATALGLAACANNGDSAGGGDTPSACELDQAGSERGCVPCFEEGAAEACFLPSKELGDNKLQCSEGTRTCRKGFWSGCEFVHEYVLDKPSQTQAIVNPTAGRETCNNCDLKCFKVKDYLLLDGGVADGSVTFGKNGGLTLLPGDGSVPDAGPDAGPVATGCGGLAACCDTLSGPVRMQCQATVAAGPNTRCDAEKPTYCPSGTITGPVPACVLGSGPDSDCDGIPNSVDLLEGKPYSTTANQTIFHQLDVGETGTNALNVTFKLNNADVYFLLDTTGTMIDERDNLVNTLTTGNVVNCAQLSQCCGTNTTCTDIVDMNNQTTCATAQATYCGGTVNCADANNDGAPDNNLKTQGVVGAVRCLVGTSWFGTGYFRELPLHKEPEPTPVSAEGQRYGDRDEVVFRHLIDMTPDYERVRVALRDTSMNYNWDEPEGGFMALYSLVSGKGHYFGINRPSIPDRTAGEGCSVTGAFGYPCFRPNAVPIVVYLTDRPSHNGPGDAASESTNCEGRGAGCPYKDLTAANSWTSGSKESASDKTAHYVPQTAEGFSTAYPLGDVRDQYFTLVGNTADMAGDYPGTIIGCAAANAAPDALITFSVSAGASIPVNFHLTKNDAYDDKLYGRWNPSWLAPGTDDPTPATEFGAVVSLFSGVPSAVSTTQNVMDKVANVVVSGPDGAYLSYVGTTAGGISAPGLWGGISGCGADGLTNQTSYTFRPTADARVVIDATTSSFPVSLSLHDGKPTALPSNPTGTGITNDNDTFATANSLLAPGSIDGAYIESRGDSSLPSVHADYTTRHTLTMAGARTAGLGVIKGLSHPELLYVGLPLSDATGWSGSPVTIASLSGNQATMTAVWTGASDAFATSIGFDDTLVGCNADPNARETVFKFNVASPRRVRIDTEGSAYDTVISLHDGQPAQAITRTDVKLNDTAANAYDLGELNSKVYTLSDVDMGTTDLPHTYDFVQCGGAAAANDAMFKFTLNRATRISLDVGSATWDPIVGLYAAVPGLATVHTNTNGNDRTVPLDVGNVLGQVSTRVNDSTLAGMADDFLAGPVGCGAALGGLDQIFKFTSSADTTIRITAAPGVANFYPVLSVFDGLPPTSTAPSTLTAFDISRATLPDTNCQAFSYHDVSTAAAGVYTVCPTRRYADEANTRCTTAGMDYLATVNTANEQAFLAKLVAPTTTSYGHHIGANVPSGTTFMWRDSTALGYTNWATGEPNEVSTQKCSAMQKGGKWEDKRCTSSGAAADDQAFYICEDTTPGNMTYPAVPAEDDTTAQVVNPAGAAVSITGSTLRMNDDYNGAVLMSSCGGTVGAGDAVFRIDTTSGFTLNADTTGSSYSPVIGLFEGAINGTTVKACDAAGGAPLTFTLLDSRTYFLVVDGTATSREGTYKLKLSDNSVTDTGVSFACASGSSVAPTASVDVEVEANHDYYLVTDVHSSSTAPSGGPYTLQFSALYQARTTVSNANPTNERGVSALSLPDPYRSKITVADTTTGGMAGDYALDMTCGGATDSPDAVYKLRPSQNTGLKVSVTPKGAGLMTPVVRLFDGPPPTTPVVHDLIADGNTNEAVGTAENVNFGSSTHLYDGNTSAMSNDTDVSLGACGSAVGGRDAMFAFSLAEATRVEIDASAGAMTNPVVRLFKDGPMPRPAAVPLTNDDRVSADANPGTPALIDGQWLQYSGNLVSLTSDAQTQSSVAATNSDVTIQDLGDLASKRVTIGGADTTSTTADYPATCTAAVGGKDTLYKLSSSTATRLHVKANATAGYDAVLALYEGPNGPPARTIDTASLTENNTGAEDAGSAWPLDVSSSGRESIELGDTSAMVHDHDVTSCGAAPTAHDAVYAFTLAAKSDVQIDASLSPNTTVVGVFDASGLVMGSAALGCANNGSGLQWTGTLSAGDYRIVVTSTVAAGGDLYDVRVKNLNYGATAATQVTCDSGGDELFYDLQANTPYYLLVKGKGAAESGSYALYLETAGTGPSMGCGASPGAADAVYKFSLASQHAVSLDTEGSSFDTVLAVYPASATAFDTEYATDAFGVKVNCDDNGGATPLMSRIDATLPAGDYYAVVKRNNFSWSTSTEPFRLSIRDSTLTSSLACASAAIGGKKITQTLQPGDYHVVVSGEAAAGGAYSLKFRDVTHFGAENGVQLACAAGSSLTYNSFESNRDYYVVVKGNTAGESGAYEMTVEDTVSLSATAGSTAVACAADGQKIEGVYPAGTYYALVSGKEITPGSYASGVYTLHAQDLDSQNDGNRLACNDDGGPNKSSAIEADLAAGTHYVVVKGKGVLDKGGYRLHVRDVDTVPDRRLACGGGTAGTSRITYDVKAGKDYTLLVKGSTPAGKGNYALNMYDSVSSPSASGSRVTCASDPQPTTLRGSNWDGRSLDFTSMLAPGTYYAAVKGVRATDSGYFQLQIGQTTAKTQTTYNPPTWATTRDALVASGVHVLPVIATKGDSGAFVSTGEAQASLLAAATGSVRADGTPIWQNIYSNGTGTGTGLVKSIAELASHLAMNVSLSAVDGPDPGASRFQIGITPQNSANCKTPHPLVDATGACSGAPGVYNCSTQYECRPGAAPKFKVTFTNPTSAPVPPNPNNSYGGYLFKLQLKGDGKYLLDEIPVFIIPTTKMVPPPPGTFRSEGVYTQNIDATSCKLERQPDNTFKFNPRSTDLPQWRDLYFKADIPEGAAIEFELCTGNTEAELNSCVWSDGTSTTRKKVTVTAYGECSADKQCVNVPGKGNGFCSDYGTCQFIDKPKVLWDASCVDDSKCENGLFGAEDYRISSHCERDSAAYGFGHCVYHSVPVDIGSTLLPTEDGKLFSRVQIKLRSNASGNLTPTLYEWYMTYRCQSSL